MYIPKLCQDKLDFTGVGVGGSGGVAAGRVKSVVVKNAGHLLAMEAVDECADQAAEWIGSEVRRWRAEEEELSAEWRKKSRIEKATVDEEWKRNVILPSRSIRTKL